MLSSRRYIIYPAGRHEGFLDTFTIHGPGWPEAYPVGEPDQASRMIKEVARLFGADLVGICERDDRWVYSHKYDRQGGGHREIDVPDSATHVIMVATAMDFDLTRTVPSANRLR